jgi:twin arginine-targeting protein translocase, TatA/E family
MPNIGAPELIIILVIALLILGPGKLPEVGASLGKSIREFRKASTDLQESVKVDVDTSPWKAGAPAAPIAAVEPVTPVAPVAPATAVETAPATAVEAAPVAPPAPTVSSDSSTVAR